MGRKKKDAEAAFFADFDDDGFGENAAGQGETDSAHTGTTVFCIVVL